MNNSPLKLPPNYSWRSYQGGTHLRKFRNDAVGEDDHFPEDWLASTSTARNGDNQQRPDEGVSHLEIDGKDVALTDLIAAEPKWFWGNQVPPVDEPGQIGVCLLYTSPSPRDQRGSRMPSSA